MSQTKKLDVKKSLYSLSATETARDNKVNYIILLGRDEDSLRILYVQRDMIHGLTAIRRQMLKMKADSEARFHFIQC